MRSLFCIVLVAILLFTLSGCNQSAVTQVDDVISNESAVETDSSATSPSTTPSPTPTPTPTPSEVPLSPSAEPTPEEDMNDEQKNAIAMLNYLALTTEEIYIAKNNRLQLEDTYTALLNEINPGSIDEITQDHLNNVRSIIKSFLNIEAKRERIQYIYNQSKAAAMREAVPDPMAILSLTNSLDWKKLAVSAVYTVVDSYNNYQSAMASTEQEYFLSGWDLDQEENDVILRNRDYAFNYMTDIVQEYGTKEDKKELGKLTLNEKAIEDFAKICIIDEVYRKTERLINAEDTYKLFGNYWLELADCYYEIEEYEKCLECIDKYYDLDISIFRQDFNIVPLLPKAIAAAQEIYTGEEYISAVSFYADAILENADSDDWSVLYFAAQTYIDLYSKTDNNLYLEKSYEIIKKNITILIDKQIELNDTYLEDVKELKLDDKQAETMTDEEKKEEQSKIDAYNKSLIETRKTELPTAYEPLILNCDLLFALADKLNLTKAEKANIQSILQTEANGVFLNDFINNKYSLKAKELDFNVEFNAEKISIPARLVSQNTSIKIAVSDDNKTTIIDNFELTEVERTGETVDTFIAHYTCKNFSEHKWSEDAVITIFINNGEEFGTETVKFKVKYFSENWIFTDTVEFEKV